MPRRWGTTALDAAVEQRGTAALACGMPQVADRFVRRLELEVSLPYLLYLPDDHARRNDWPLVVFLHGSGERGDDPELVRKHGLARLLHEGLALPAVVVSPQCPENHGWVQHHPALMALIDDVVTRYRVDPDRIVLTGLSMGGAGVCALAAEHPERFAALAPVCGPEMWFEVTSEFARLPMWVFHGDADDVVPVSESLELVERVRALGGNPRLTVYEGVGHNSWDRAYGDSELQTWLVEQRRPA